MDKRRHLYEEFLRYVEAFRPKVFVIENVLGIKSAAGGRYFTKMQVEARRLGYRVHPQIEKACELGVAQRRIRQLIIGTRLDLGSYFPSGLDRAPQAVENPTLGEAIGDLPPLGADEATTSRPTTWNVGGGTWLATDVATSIERWRCSLPRVSRLIVRAHTASGICGTSRA